MSELSAKLGLPYIMASQAQKHVTHNEALKRLDLVTQLAVLDRDRVQPPALPGNGDRHIVADLATGIWSGQDGKIAAFVDGAWEYLTPQDGWICPVLAEGIVLMFDGTTWASMPVSLTSDDLQNAPGLGVNTSFDTTNRLAVSAPATLLSHEGAGHQVKVNKAATADTASLLFQSNWVGNAEMGLAGQDDFSVKVSPDGTTWHTALTIDRSSGVVSAPKAPVFKAVLGTDQTIGPGAWTVVSGFNALIDQTGSFNHTLGAFVAPAPGFYSFSFVWRFKASGAVPNQIRAGIGVNTSSPPGPDQVTQGDATLVTQESSVLATTILELQSGDEVYAYALSAGGSATIEAVFSAFQGFKIA